MRSRRLSRFSPLLALYGLVACDDPKPSAPPPSPPTPPATVASVAAATTTSAAPEAPPVPAASYDVDQSHSRLGFAVRHMMVSNTRGHFAKFVGTAYVDESQPAASKVSLDIDTASIDSSDPKRDEHLRSADFFDVKKYPKMTFRSTDVTRDKNGWHVRGDLTVRDVVKPVVLEVEPLSPPVKDPWGNVRRGTHARAKLDRKELGLTWNKALETGGVAVGNEVTLELEVELVERKAK